MEKKLTPLQMVAREMAEHSDFDSESIVQALVGLLSHLSERASVELDADPNSATSVRCAREYRVISEVLMTFGTQLIAFEDIDREMLPSN